MIRARVSAPVAGSHLRAGSVSQVRWQTPSNVTVPNVQTDQAKVAVEMVEPADGTMEGILGVSEAFSIEAVVGVGVGGPAQFALRGVTPNPAQHELRVSFSLRDSKPAGLQACGTPSQRPRRSST